MILPTKYEKKLNNFFEIPPSAIITPPRINKGTAKIGVEFAPLKVLSTICGITPPRAINKIGATEPKIILIPMGIDKIIATRNITKTNNAAIVYLPPSALIPASNSAFASS